MGILNSTNDSFYSQSRVPSLDTALSVAAQMLKDGATLLDIGGYSTRPNAEDVPLQAEIDRVCPIIEQLSLNFPHIFLSIDTFRAEVAEAALRAGAHLINDISGGQLDPAIWQIAAKYKAPYVLMHSRGTPKTMMQLTQYEDLVPNIFDFFTERIQTLHQLGLTDIVLDLGFGFAKDVAQNYQLLANLNVFKAFHLPILVGVSRKSMICKPLQIKPELALNGTTVLNTLALTRGARILRVHDVREASEAIRLHQLFEENFP